MKKTALLVCACAVAVAMPLAGAQARTAARATAAPSGLDKEWLMTSMQGDLSEVMGGRVALKLSRDKAVVKLARTLIKDHSQSFKKASTLARQLGVDVPKAPTFSQQWALKMLSTLRGRAFNHWYSTFEAYDHEQDISETTGEVRDGSLDAVRMEAKDDLPMLQRHLKLAQAALRANP